MRDIDRQLLDAPTPAEALRLIAQGADVNAIDAYGDTAIHEAALNGRHTMVQFWLDRGAPVDMTGFLGQTPLLKAASVDTAEVLVARGANVNAVDYDGNMAIHAAALNGRDTLVQFWLDRGVAVDTPCQFDRTPLMLAANEATVDVLIAGGADVDARDANRDTAIHVAAGEGRYTVVQFWLDRGVPVDAQGFLGQTALMQAANAATAELLIARDADVNARDHQGNQAIHLAALDRRYTMVQFWLDRGVPADARGFAGRTVLMQAPNSAIAELLIERGADLDARDSSGNLALHVAAFDGHHIMVRFWLLDKNVPVDIRGANGRTALMYVVNVATAEFLIDQGADIDARDEHGNMAIHVAALHGCEDMVRFWLDRDVPVNVRGLNGRTALMQAGSQEIAELLIARGADVDAIDDQGNAAIHVAALNGKAEVVKFWLDRGVPVNIKSAGGRTPLMQAGSQAVVELLRANSAIDDAGDRAEPGLGSDSTKPAAGFWTQYYPSGLEQLLKLRLAGAEFYMREAVEFDVQLGKFARTALLSAGTRPTIVPVLYNTQSDKPAHWVGLVITKSARAESEAESTETYTVTYIDPENKPMPRPLIGAVFEHLPAGTVVDFGQKLVAEQSCSDNCGPELVEGFAELITGSRVAEPLVPAAHSLLLENSLMKEAEQTDIPTLHLKPASTTWSVNLFSDPWQAVGEIAEQIQKAIYSVIPEQQTDEHVAQLANLFALFGFFESGGFTPSGWSGRKPDDPGGRDGGYGGGNDGDPAAGGGMPQVPIMGVSSHTNETLGEAQ